LSIRHDTNGRLIRNCLTRQFVVKCGTMEIMLGCMGEQRGPVRGIGQVPRDRRRDRP